MADGGTRRRPWYGNPEMIVALSAVVVSVCAVVVGVWSAWIEREHARASVWPRVELFRSFGSDRFSYGVINGGMGPAIVRWARVGSGGEAHRSWREVLLALDAPEAPFVQSHLSTRIVGVDKQLDVFRTVDAALAAALAARDEEVEIELCYCSVFDECWHVDRGNVPRAVADCDVVPDRAFEE